MTTIDRDVFISLAVVTKRLLPVNRGIKNVCNHYCQVEASRRRIVDPWALNDTVLILIDVDHTLHPDLTNQKGGKETVSSGSDTQEKVVFCLFSHARAESSIMWDRRQSLIISSYNLH